MFCQECKQAQISRREDTESIKFKAGEIKCCKETKITAMPNITFHYNIGPYIKLDNVKESKRTYGGQGKWNHSTPGMSRIQIVTVL